MNNETEFLDKLRADLPDGWTVDTDPLGPLPDGHVNVPLGSAPGVESITVRIPNGYMDEIAPRLLALIHKYDETAS